MYFAVFLDILGTSKYFLELPDDYSFENDDDHLGYRWVRSEFHRAIQGVSKTTKSDLVFVASFSDCAYLIYRNPRIVLLSTKLLMSWLYQSGVPVRGGIGYGNFGFDKALHNATRHFTSTESSFFGSSIVRAHLAEQCGHKGLRMFVHDSAANLLSKTHEGLLVYPEDKSIYMEEDPRPETVSGTVVPLEGYSDSISSEICFIGDESIDMYLRALEMMEVHVDPGDPAQIHYNESRRAIEKFKNLRQSKFKLETSDHN